MVDHVINTDRRSDYLLGLCPVAEAVEAMAVAGSETRGAVFTKCEVVEFILDLVGYTSDQPLYQKRLLEPSFGNGDFLFPAIERLLDSWNKSEKRMADFDVLKNSIRATEIHIETFQSTRRKIVSALKATDFSAKQANMLADIWLINDDFLLAEIDGLFDVAIGNPPYVRQELIPDPLIAEYRNRYKTIFDRADLYVPFIERSLSSLREGGQLGFICADRWMKNRYGGPLRNLVAENFHFRIYVDMFDTPAFHSDVIAYPAVTVIAREKAGPTRIAHRPEIARDTLSSLANELLASKVSKDGQVKEMADVAIGSEPWILESSDQLSLVRRLERDFPCIEDAGCKVGIGVATGADKAFIAPFNTLDVEEDRKLPLAMTKDIQQGEVNWRGFGVINPFAENGRLVDLKAYPRLHRYLEGNKDIIAGRHVAKKSPANWYRTIDRIYPELATKPKLLIPDIKGNAHIVFENQGLYPHHNLYFIVSREWDLEALQAVLISGIARLFVAVYSTKMRGGYLRFQAQYLRRIRIPRWKDVSATIRKQLVSAARSGDPKNCNEAVFALYGLNREERVALGGNGAA